MSALRFGGKQPRKDTRPGNVAAAVRREEWRVSTSTPGSVAVHSACVIRQMSSEPPDVLGARARLIASAQAGARLAEQVLKVRGGDGEVREGALGEAELQARALLASLEG